MGKQLDGLEIASLTRLQRSLIGKPKSRDSRVAAFDLRVQQRPLEKRSGHWT